MKPGRTPSSLKPYAERRRAIRERMINFTAIEKAPEDAPPQQLPRGPFSALFYTPPAPSKSEVRWMQRKLDPEDKDE